MKRLFKKNLVPVHRARLNEISFGKRQDVDRPTLIYIYGFIILAVFIIFSLRLFDLTVVKGEYYRRLSEENRIREIVIEPKRGTILDRKGFVVAESKDGDNSLTSGRISSSRIYSAPEETAHIIGYRQIADKGEIQNDSCLNHLDLGDKTGKRGVERMFECQLRGRNGKKLTEVDAGGKYINTVAIAPPQNGDTIQLAMDLDLQKKAYELIKGKRAAVIVLDPKTGKILALSSTPSFNIQQFENANPSIESYFTDTEKPLFNRATEGAYPPGSIFKLVVATGALESGKITEKTVVEDTGQITAGPLTFGNWYFLQYGKTEGMVDFVKALQRSNDIYFYKAGEVLGPEGIRDWSEKFGLGVRIPFAFEQSEGLIPSAFWKEEVLNEKWYLGDTYNFSIGQGYTLVTPLQMALASSVFANNGYLCTPQLLKNGQIFCYKLPVSQKTIEFIRTGMKKACETGGTGYPLFDFKVKNLGLRMKKLSEIPEDKKASAEAAMDRDPTYWNAITTGCKTGTAESRDATSTSHAWFTVFAPFENPEIAVTVLVEEGGQGSDVAAPIARDILKAYFERNE
ncbi:hypothetical protein COY87_02690 [Candidatus Roizmanbacteria bacterium CG_4_10_14_0_8_um_filter_33_9]|uniref:Penicillin-binding protein 2 n=1 Tax=Candidatus Roizmanbacteria bacterium CG_4_10_14_0_8_um_filter_33_9 TaxID=1974826 RepID=A0A2M7QJU2_9BACT|nr:MAG: hypothetical protein COY87_02690 [Candidatus Roizmanbacteria bacterium CG_4_10_14_0_8_um_filter_33_9]